LSTYQTLTPQRTINQEVLRFDIEKPSKTTRILVVILGLILNYFWFLRVGYLPGLLLLAIIIPLSVYLWHKLGNQILNKAIAHRFEEFYEKYKDEQEPGDFDLGSNFALEFLGNVILTAIGFRLSDDDLFFIEADISDKNIRGLKDILQTGIIDGVASSLGISMIIAITLKLILSNVIFVNYSTDQLVNILFFIVIISPILIFFITPVVWVFEDAQIRTLDHEDGLTSNDLSENIREGPAGNLLGWGGIIFGISLLMSISAGTIDNTISQFTFSILILLVYGSALYGEILIITTIYFTVFHEQNVNQFRQLLSNFLPLGESLVVVKNTQTTENLESSIQCHCGAIMPSTIKFCTKCGEKLIREVKTQNQFCVYCGQQFNATDKYCQRCGGKR